MKKGVYRTFAASLALVFGGCQDDTSINGSSQESTTLGKYDTNVMRAIDEAPKKTRDHNAYKKIADDAHIEGKPVSVFPAYNGENASLVLVLEIDAPGRTRTEYENPFNIPGVKPHLVKLPDKDYILAKTPVFHSSDLINEITEAAAMIQSEISDSDNEHVSLSGGYDSNRRFIIRRVLANGYGFDFDG